MPQQITLGLAFTDEELTKAILIMRDDPEHFHDRCKNEIIVPALERINTKLQQEHDPDWLAYFLEHALVETQRRMLAQTTENKDERTAPESH